MGKLTKVEISFFRWLSKQGGKCALSENNPRPAWVARLTSSGSGISPFILSSCSNAMARASRARPHDQP